MAANWSLLDPRSCCRLLLGQTEYRFKITYSMCSSDWDSNRAWMLTLMKVLSRTISIEGEANNQIWMQSCRAQGDIDIAIR